MTRTPQTTEEIKQVIANAVGLPRHALFDLGESAQKAAAAVSTLVQFAFLLHPDVASAQWLRNNPRRKRSRKGRRRAYPRAVSRWISRRLRGL